MVIIHDFINANGENMVLAMVFIIFASGIMLAGFFGRKPGKAKGLADIGKSCRKRLRRPQMSDFEDFAVVKKIRKRKIQREICSGLSVLRNLMSDESSAGLSSDAVLVRLAKKGGELEKVYLRMLSLVRMNQPEAARKCFEEADDSMLAKEYAGLLLRWDTTKASEMREIVLSFQRGIIETASARASRKDEIISDIVYIPAIVNVMMVFLNFVYVGYFMQQKEMLGSLFGSY